MDASNPQYDSKDNGAVYDAERNNAMLGHHATPAAEEEAPRQHAKRRQSTRRDGADVTTAVWSLGGPLSLTLFASVVQSATALRVCDFAPCEGEIAYSVAAGLVSAILVFIYLVLFTFARDQLPEKGMMFLALFLFFWWMAAVGVLTFSSAALILPTGYFAIWASFLFSGFIMHTEFTQFKAVVDRVGGLANEAKATFYLLLASIVEVISAAVSCGEGGQCTGLEVYALIVGGVSAILCLLLLKVDGERFQGMEKGISLFLCLWWAIGMGVLTIQGPFLGMGNGFFSTWLAFFSSFFVAEHHLFPRA